MEHCFFESRGMVNDNERSKTCRKRDSPAGIIRATAKVRILKEISLIKVTRRGRTVIE